MIDDDDEASRSAIKEVFAPPFTFRDWAVP